MWLRVGSINKDYAVFWTNFIVYIVPFPPILQKLDIYKFSIYYNKFSFKFCQLAEYAPPRDNPRDVPKQTVFNS